MAWCKANPLAGDVSYKHHRFSFACSEEAIIVMTAEDDELLTSIPLSPPILGGSPLPVLPNPAPETLDESRKWKSLVAFEGEITITDQVRALNLSRF
jgi:hypothetical protein